MPPNMPKLYICECITIILRAKKAKMRKNNEKNLVKNVNWAILKGQ